MLRIFYLFTVVKFKRRQRYLEFFVQVAQKALTEGMATQVMDWCEDTSSWLTKYVYSLFNYYTVYPVIFAII